MHGISERGFDSVAFCAGDESPVHLAFEAEGVEAVDYTPTEVSYRHPRAFLRASYRLARDFQRRRIDLVHCSDLLAAYHAGLAGRLAGIPVVCHIRCDYTGLSRRDQLILHAVHRFVFVSEHTKEVFPFRGAEGRGTVLYDGIAMAEANDEAGSREEVFNEFGIPADSTLVGMVARLAPIKDYATLVSAAVRVVNRAPAVRFLIIGDHSGADTYRTHYIEVLDMLRRAGIADRFIFTGFRPDIPRLLAALDIAILVSHSEGLPLVLLEAMARAKPVVATAVGGIPEVVIDGQTGLLHKHGDAIHLATAILSLVQDPASGRQLGDAGLRFVRRRFSEEQFVSGLISVYRKLLRPGI